MTNADNLARFVEAQALVYPRALAEIRGGAKTGHWMWFIFPQIIGLGFSHMAQLYAIASLDEARAYLAHSILGRRYRECVAALPLDSSAIAAFGKIDAIKLRSSLTLFERAGAEVGTVIDRWYGGDRDPATLAHL